MTSKDVRRKYLEFFAARGHAVIPSAPLVPENDPTTLFTSSGMQPLVPYLLGEAHPMGTRLVNSQRSFRAEDIDEVGDNRHTTFFEMLGNWSLGDADAHSGDGAGYGRREQLSWSFELLTDVVGLDPKKLYATVFEGDPKTGVPKDDISISIWKELFAGKGIDAETRIFAYDAQKNWWSRSGVPEKMPIGEPGGPDSEVFFEFTDVPHNEKYGTRCHPNCDCGRFVEIGNSVFMEYKRGENGFEKLLQPNIDFGGGLERITAASINSPDIFRTDLFWGVMEELSRRSTKTYAGNEKTMRIIADHLRAAAQMTGDGVCPSNSDQGYVLRRLVRRAVRHADTLGLPQNTLSEIVPAVLEPFAGVYDYVLEKKNSIAAVIREEEEKFRATLSRGLRHFENLTGNAISGQDAFALFTSYGFPLELTRELAAERNMTVDEEGFKTAMWEHRALSRASAEQKFKGGLADHSEKNVQYHTLTHILQEALRRVLGTHIEQRGSNITSERLRFDFSNPAKMTAEQIGQVEKIVNQEIAKHHSMTYRIMAVPEARVCGAIGVFPDRYDEAVKVYTLGDENTGVFSKEICGGPHVSNTNEIKGRFKIIKEEAVAAGIRRIKAVLE